MVRHVVLLPQSHWIIIIIMHQIIWLQWKKSMESIRMIVEVQFKRRTNKILCLSFVFLMWWWMFSPSGVCCIDLNVLPYFGFYYYYYYYYYYFFFFFSKKIYWLNKSDMKSDQCQLWSNEKICQRRVLKRDCLFLFCSILQMNDFLDFDTNNHES